VGGGTVGFGNFSFSFLPSKFRPAAAHAHTKPGRSAEGARSVLDFFSGPASAGP
jgi:hypothetical protein